MREYIDTLLPENWDSMDLFERRNFLNGNEFGGERRTGTIRRESVSNMEIWCECFGKHKEDIKPADSYAIAAIMLRMEGWDKTGKLARLPIYGRQRYYQRQQPTCSR